MAYQCPRCNGAVRRGTSRGGTLVGGLAGGLAGALVMAMVSYVLGSMHCERCGPIPKKEFPAEARSEMLVGSLTLVSVGALALVGAIYYLATLHR